MCRHEYAFLLLSIFHHPCSAPLFISKIHLVLDIISRPKRLRRYWKIFVTVLEYCRRNDEMNNISSRWLAYNRVAFFDTMWGATLTELAVLVGYASTSVQNSTSLRKFSIKIYNFFVPSFAPLLIMLPSNIFSTCGRSCVYFNHDFFPIIFRSRWKQIFWDPKKKSLKILKLV